MLKSYFYRKLTGPRTGRIYYVPALGRTYQASAPGEYPAEKFGHLRRGIRFQTGISIRGPYLVLGVANEAVLYATELEDPGSRAPRPFLRRGMIENQSTIQRMLKKPFVAF